ncbi:MAG TPA: dihydroorotase [Flavitalea sp.]|nr:dihydroorotase [Flavitalea sp.]
MNVLIQQAEILDSQASLFKQRKDLLIQDGIITDIADNIDPANHTIINGQSLQVSPGWVDVFSNFADPGYEFKETIETGSAAAAAGGFTDVLVIPNTKPVIDSKSQVEYVRFKSSGLPVNIYPIGSVSKNAEGKDLAEMYDMHASGAIAFGDGLNPVQSAGLLLKALQYVSAIDAVIIQIPDDRTVGANGLMNEGIVSTQLGLAGKPIMAEELLIARDIKLARYTNSKIHFTGVTSPKSLEYIRRAKDGGINVTCSVTPYHLYYTEEDLQQYDTNLKVYPPLRGRNSVNALVDALKNGTIDCIATHHMPHEYDSKVLEFEYAKNGMTGLETCFHLLKMAVPSLEDSRWVELLSTNPRRIFGLPQPVIEVGQPALLTIFSSSGETTITNQFFSKSKNNPLINQVVPGKIYGIINGTKSFIKNNNH